MSNIVEMKCYHYNVMVYCEYQFSHLNQFRKLFYQSDQAHSTYVELQYNIIFYFKMIIYSDTYNANIIATPETQYFIC